MWTKGAGGKFTGSTGGRGGSGGGGDTKRLGGKRGVKARTRLRKALATVRDAQRAHSAAKSSGGDTKATRKKLRRSVRAARLHQRETVRVERRGHQPIVMKARKATAQRATPEIKARRLKSRLRKQREKLEGLEGGKQLIASRGQSTHHFDRPIGKAARAARRLKSALERLRGAKSG